jgi:hypothetical protein
MYLVLLRCLCAAHTVHCTVQHTLYTVLCSTHCTLYCAAHTVHCIVQHTLYTELCSTHCTLYCSAHTVHCTVQHTLYTVLCSTHCTLHCAPHTVHCTVEYFLYSPHHQIFSQFVYSEITWDSACRVLFGPLWCCLLLWQLKVIRIRLTSILNFCYPGTSCLMQEVLVLYIFFYLMSCTHKCWREHSLADTVPLFWQLFSFPQNWIITEVLLWPVYALH